MSILKTNTIQHISSSTPSALTTSGGDLTNAAGISYMANKNLFYNGAMQVAQRGTSTASITAGGYYTADRWALALETLGTWTQSVENDAPTGSGFRKSLKMLCTTADASPAAGDLLFWRQPLEGQDLQRIAKGTSSAQQLTLSFWVKSNVTGTYVCNLVDNDNTRMVSGSYTISASATWEKKTITFAADTTGAFDNDNAVSLYVNWWLAAGSTYTSGALRSAWTATANGDYAVGQTNLAAATNNYWQVTGVQLEVGPVASSFEFKSFGQELAQCQRYFCVIADGSGQTFGTCAYYFTTEVLGTVFFPVTMRAAPTFSAASGSYYEVQTNVTADALSGVQANTISSRSANIFANSSNGASGTTGHGGQYRTTSASANISFSAEL